MLNPGVESDAHRLGNCGHAEAVACRNPGEIPHNATRSYQSPYKGCSQPGADRLFKSGGAHVAGATLKLNIIPLS